MESHSDADEVLIITILIQMHGKVITFDLNDVTTRIFDNVRLLCKAGDFKDYESSGLQEISLVDALRDQYFTKDLATSTYDILKQARSGILVDNVTYDKTLSTTVSDPTLSDYLNPITYYQGIYLLSIHYKRKLIYPGEDKRIINLLNVTDLERLATIFHTRVPNLQDLSTPFPSQNTYINEENRIKQNSLLTAGEKEAEISQIRRQYWNRLNNWELTLERNKIVSIKLSTFVELIKTIVGGPCFINILDYSCNSPTIYIPREQGSLKQYALKTPDIETGISNTNMGGNKRTRRIKRTRRHKRTRLYKYNKTKKHRINRRIKVNKRRRRQRKSNKK